MSLIDVDLLMSCLQCSIVANFDRHTFVQLSTQLVGVSPRRDIKKKKRKNKNQKRRHKQTTNEWIVLRVCITMEKGPEVTDDDGNRKQMRSPK